MKPTYRLPLLLVASLVVYYLALSILEHVVGFRSIVMYAPLGIAVAAPLVLIFVAGPKDKILLFLMYATFVGVSFLAAIASALRTLWYLRETYKTDEAILGLIDSYKLRIHVGFVPCGNDPVCSLEYQGMPFFIIAGVVGFAVSFLTLCVVRYVNLQVKRQGGGTALVVSASVVLLLAGLIINFQFTETSRRNSLPPFMSKSSSIERLVAIDPPANQFLYVS